jgi:ferric iron reductase protein FhuF
LRRPTVAVLATDPLAERNDPRVMVVADNAALLAQLRRTIVDEHLTPLMAGIRARVHLGRRTLWGSLASGAAHGLARLAGSVPGQVLPMIDDVLGAFDVADLVDVRVEVPGRLRIDRRTCCLAFTLPEPKICAGCCIR